MSKPGLHQGTNWFRMDGLHAAGVGGARWWSRPVEWLVELFSALLFSTEFIVHEACVDTPFPLTSGEGEGGCCASLLKSNAFVLSFLCLIDDGWNGPRVPSFVGFERFCKVEGERPPQIRRHADAFTDGRNYSLFVSRNCFGQSQF